MADIPRDPRQLARDILAGKISIEELAREQQRRAGAPMRPLPQTKLPDRIPLPRQAPPAQPQRPVVRQPSSFPQQRPAPQRPVPRPPVAKSPPPRRPTIQQAPPMARTAASPQAPAAPDAPQNPTDSYLTPVRPMTAVAGALAIGKVVRNRAALRQCMVMAEVLGKPVALREEW